MVEKSKQSGRPKINTVGKFKEGKGKVIAQVLFMYDFPLWTVSKIIYPKLYTGKKGFVKGSEKKVIPRIQAYVSEWKKQGFLDEKKGSVLVHRRTKNKTIEYLSPQEVSYRLNLEPMYEYFKMKGITFSENQRSFIFQMLGQESLRPFIVREFPEEDIIQACIKFYIKVYILPYANSPSAESRIKMRDKIIKNFKKLHNPNKKNSKKNQEVIDKVWNYNKLRDKGSFEDNMTNAFIIHKLVEKANPKFCSEVDGKFIKAHFGDVSSK